MSTLLFMAVVGAVACAIGFFVARSAATAPTSAMGEPPTSLDRADFRSPDAPWLVAVFTSATCSSCAAVLAELQGHESADVVVQEVEVGRRPDLHDKYRIDSVPTAVVARSDGDARLAFVGPIGPEHRAALATTLRADDR